MMGCDTELCPNWTGDGCICEARDIAPPACCRACGHGPHDHDAEDFGGGCGICGDCPGYDDGLDQAEDLDDLDDDAGEVEYFDIATMSSIRSSRHRSSSDTLGDLVAAMRLIREQLALSTHAFDRIQAALYQPYRQHFALVRLIELHLQQHPPPLAIDGHAYHRRRRARARARRPHRRRGGPR